jgi:hypothetical protein
VDTPDKSDSFRIKLQPDGAMLRGDFETADRVLTALLHYLDSSISAIEKRKACVAPPLKWKLQQLPPGEGEELGEIHIDHNFYPHMAPSKTQVMDADDGFKMTARPAISSEEVFVFDAQLLGGDRRSTAAGPAECEFTEGELLQLKRKHKNLFRKVELTPYRPADEIFSVSERGMRALADLDLAGCALWFSCSTKVLRRKAEFAKMLRDHPAKQHAPLKQILEPEHVWPKAPSYRLEEGDWIDPAMRNLALPGVEEQRDFVRKALGTEDFTMVWGPAGAGKTTAICEFIKQAVRIGRKVLMVGSTHVAVDNVLAKFAPDQESSMAKDGDQVIAVRVGRGEKVAKPVQPLLMQNFIRREAQRIKAKLQDLIKTDPVRSSAAALMLKSMDKDLGKDFVEGLDAEEQDGEAPLLRAEEGALFKMIMEGANLVGGTPIGILGHPALQSVRDTKAYPEFDYLIVDEASKMTLDEFLVPAMCAKAWIIVGDPYQLAPFCEEEELGASLLAALEGVQVSKDGETLGLVEAVPFRRDLRKAIELALKERAVRFKGGDYHAQLSVERKLAVEKLGTFVAEMPSPRHGLGAVGISVDHLCDQTFALVLPSVLESLLGERDGLLPSPRSLIRPFGSALASRLVELKYQFRMDRRIADFCKNHVYGGRLLLTPPDARPKSRLHSLASGDDGRFVVLTSADSSLLSLKHPKAERKSPQQLALAVWELMEFADWAKRHGPNKGEPWKAYLISTYKDQNGLCRRLVRYLYAKERKRFGHVKIEANTVDSCQGLEADLVLLSFVKDHQTPFMRSLNRMNVAFTRAKSRLVVLGDLPAKTTEAARNPTLLDALHDYGPSKETAKNLQEAVAIVNRALA